MAINRERLQVKLNAILEKDVAEITRQKVYIPYLGNDYTEDQLRAWLAKKADILVAMSKLSDKKISSLCAAKKAALGEDEKQKYEKFAQRGAEEMDETTYDKMVELCFYDLVITS